MADNNYYIYQYITEDGLPYYIGKGSGTRIREYHLYTEVPPAERRIILKYRKPKTDSHANNIKNAVKNLWADPEYKQKRLEKMMETRRKNGHS
jgi:hypothetical protein